MFTPQYFYGVMRIESRILVQFDQKQITFFKYSE
jgi:hypothetical protein